jgi:hypothetical protein
MNKSTLRIASAALALALTMLPNAFAATQTATVSVSAQVQSALSFDVILVKVNPVTNAESGSASMQFGELKKNGFGGLDASNFFKVYMTANTQSLPYTITQNGTAVSNGTTTLPNNACKVTPTYNPADNGGATNPGTVGTSGTWVGNRTLYTSNAAGAVRTISAFYGLVGDPSTGAGNFIPESQATGNYAGTIVFTMTA